MNDIVSFVKTCPLQFSILCVIISCMRLTEVLLVTSINALFSSQVQEKERKGTIKTRSRPWKWSRPSFFRSVARAGSEGCWRAAWYQAWWLGPVFTRRKRRCWTGWCCTNQGAGKYNLLLPLEGMLDSAPENELSCGRSPSCSLSHNSVILLFPWRCKLFFQSPWNLAS